MNIKRSALFIIVVAIAIVAGFVMLLRGCLAKFDERAALPPLLYFQQPGKAVIFSLVKFEKTTSYSSGGGMTRRTVSTSYHIQINDAQTGKKLDSRKIKKHSRIKQYPVEIMGQSGNWAWAFIGEPMAFDAFTLEKKADLDILAEVNPILRGRLPAERRYYTFDGAAETIYITATDGSKWKMNARTLRAEPTEEDGEETNPLTRAINQLVEQEKENLRRQDTLYQSKNRDMVEKYQRREIDYATYQRFTKQYFTERDKLYRERDSLQKEKNKLSGLADSRREIYQLIDRLNHSSTSFYSIKVNADTINGQWYALYAREEEKDMTNDYFYYRAQSNETARRLFRMAPYRLKDNGSRIERGAAKTGKQAFLDGGFLLSKKTGRPIFDDKGFLVIHKDKIGNEGLIQLSLVNRDGDMVWTVSSELKEWSDWIETPSQLIIAGNGRKELSGSEISRLLIVNRATGKVTGYDFFSDK